jgi:hypothetical protein
LNAHVTTARPRRPPQWVSASAATSAPKPAGRAGSLLWSSWAHQRAPGRHNSSRRLITRAQASAPSAPCADAPELTVLGAAGILGAGLTRRSARSYHRQGLCFLPVKLARAGFGHDRVAGNGTRATTLVVITCLMLTGAMASAMPTAARLTGCGQDLSDLCRKAEYEEHNCCQQEYRRQIRCRHRILPSYPIPHRGNVSDKRICATGMRNRFRHDCRVSSRR